MSDAELRKIARLMKEQGITVSVNRAPGAAFREPSAADEIARVAREEGIYYEEWQAGGDS